MKRQKPEIGEKGEGQSKVLVETRKIQPQSPMGKWPQEGRRPWLLRDQVRKWIAATGHAEVEGLTQFSQHGHSLPCLQAEAGRVRKVRPLTIVPQGS